VTPEASRRDDATAAAGSAGGVDERAYALASAGRRGEALALVRAALVHAPADGALRLALGNLLFDWGRYREARVAFLDAHAVGERRVALLLNLAWTCHLLGRTEEAETHARAAIAADPSTIPGHLGLGAVLQRQRRFDDAIASFARVLDLDSANVEAVESIAGCHIERKDYAAAETWARRALALADARPRAWNTLGIALSNQQRGPEALDALRRAYLVEKARGGAVDSIVDYGFAMILAGQYREAVALYRAELPCTPKPGAHAHYAFALLALGEYAEGWRQYEFRWLQEPHLANRPDASRPPWCGQDLAHRTLLIRAEQGFGDIFQFARFAATFKAKGARVILQARREIAALAVGFAGVDEVFVPPAATPPHDYYVHLMSIPDALGTGFPDIAVPYLGIGDTRRREWQERTAASGLRVGIVWAGNPLHSRDRYRSMSEGDLAPLLAVEGVHFFSLQKQAAEVPWHPGPAATNWTDLAPGLQDFEDTAAAIANLDLVVCVDTAVAHLAGALGKPVWLMLPAIGDFRWIANDPCTPWYPTMRLFWQPVLGAWDDVVARVAAELRNAVANGLPVVAAAPVQPRARTPDHARLPGDPHIAEVVETRYGIVQFLPDDGDVARSLRHYGEYLQEHVEIFARLIGPGSTVVDADSGIGVHTIALARMVGADGCLMTYESRELPARLLAQNLAANRVSQPVTAMRGMLAGPVAAREAGGDPGAGIAQHEECETIDDLGLDRLDLLRLDGAVVPPEILDGASATLWRLRPRVFVHAPDAVVRAAFAVRLSALGYRCWNTDVPLFDPRNHFRRTDDIFAGRSVPALVALPEEASDVALPDSCVEAADAGGSGLREADPAQAAPSDPAAGGRPAGIGATLKGLLFGRGATTPKSRR